MRGCAWIVGVIVVSVTGCISPELSVEITGEAAGSVVSSPAGVIDCGALCDRVIDEDAPLVLHARPAIGSTFVGWRGACSGTDDCHVHIVDDSTVEARFEIAENTVSVGLRGSGRGTVEAPAIGLACGERCDGLVAYGETVTLVATPATGSRFVGWRGPCDGPGTCTLRVTEPIQLEAQFARDEQRDAQPFEAQQIHEVVAVVEGPGAVQVLPSGTRCRGTCRIEVARGTAIEIVPESDPGSVFLGWSGGCGGTAACRFTVLAPTVTVTARFVAPIAPATPIAVLSFPNLSPGGVQGLGFDAPGNAFVIDGWGRAVWTIDPTSGAALATHPLATTGNVRSLVFVATQLYTLRDSTLATVTLSSGGVMTIGTIGQRNFASLTRSLSTGGLWLADDCADPACTIAQGARLSTVDPLTGATTLVHDLPSIGQATAVAIAPDGRARLATFGIDGTASIWIVDFATGNAVLGTRTGLPWGSIIVALAYDPNTARLYGIEEQRAASPRTWRLVRF